MANKMTQQQQQVWNTLKYPQGADRVRALHRLLDMLAECDKYRRDNGLPDPNESLHTAIMLVMDEAHRSQ